MSTGTIHDLITKLTESKKAKTDTQWTDEYEKGNTKINNINKQYEEYTKDMYKAVNDLVYKSDDSYHKSQTNATDVLLPQLRFINELTHVINTFPHQKLPQTTAFLAELTERAKYTMQNITNFNGVVIGEPAVSMERVVPTVPYVNVQGGGHNSSDSEEFGDYNHPDSSSESEEPEKPAVSRLSSKPSSNKAKSQGSDDSDEAPSKKHITKKHKKKVNDDVLSKSSSSESAPQKDESSSDIEKVADTSSSSSSLAQEGGRRKKKVKRTKKKTNQAHTRTL